jgi:hypothetical protein
MLSYDGGWTKTFPTAGSSDLPLANDPKSSDVVASDIAGSPEVVEDNRSEYNPCLRSAAVGT